jgi:hypothetical protein
LNEIRNSKKNAGGTTTLIRKINKYTMETKRLIFLMGKNRFWCSSPSTNNKRDMEAFQEDDDEFEEDYKDGSSLNDTLLRKIGMLCQRCIENERLIKRLKDGVDIVKIYSGANKTSDKERLRLGWQGG